MLLTLFLAVAPATKAAPASVLSGSQVARVAYTAGCRGHNLDMAVAIARAESGFNPYAYGDAAIGGSRGLWQIYGPAHPQWANSSMFNPQANANAMFAISGGCRNFQPWTAFRTEAYLPVMHYALAGSVPAAAPAPQRMAPAATHRAPTQRAGSYVVVRGDTLSKIAARNHTSWQRIFALNRDRIRNPNLIFPRQALRLP
ncbi:MAG: LysM peptidoglycan-binding domain-containing protein [Ktedonobacterales bacterium]